MAGGAGWYVVVWKELRTKGRLLGPFRSSDEANRKIRELRGGGEIIGWSNVFHSTHRPAG